MTELVDTDSKTSSESC